MRSLRLPGRTGTPKPADLATAREAFRVLRSNLLVALHDTSHQIIVITSARPQEGKTSTCVSLAQSLAAAGSRVVLVDLDLRRPDSHRVLGAHNEVGVSDVLLGRLRFEDCLQYISVPGARLGVGFLAAGPPVGDSTELLATQRMRALLETLASRADVVLLDSPPVLPVADTLVIGRLAAGAVLVVDSSRTPAPVAKRAKDALTRSQTRLLGVVLNRFESKFSEPAYGDAVGEYGAEFMSIAESESSNGSRVGRRS